MSERIRLAESDDEIQICYPVMAELRPHLKPDEFVERVRKQAKNAGYELAYLMDAEVKAVAGFRISEWLAGGKYMEIEDLAARSGERSKGYGGELFDWLVERAKRENCDQLRLVSHVRRFDAHRFYLNRRMIIEAHYFSMPLK